MSLINFDLVPFLLLQLNYFAIILLYAIIIIGDGMIKRKYDAATMIIKKLNNESFMTYKEIAELTGYHEKYILKLKKDILERKIRLEHGNTNRKPINTISPKEEHYICDLYKRSHASIRQFSRFYSKRSYACIYNVLKRNDLLKNSEER